MRPQAIFGLVAVMVATVSVAGCWKRSGQAVVLEKEHIVAAEPSPTPAPAAGQSASPSGSTPSPSESPADEVEYKLRVLADDEIEIGNYVMKKELRGTSRDPRAITEEQWIVRVQMVDDLKRISVQTDRAHFDKLKVGDRIKVSYRQGKYTGTVWYAEID